jgi:Domain of unknown function (DUF4386)
MVTTRIPALAMGAAMLAAPVTGLVAAIALPVLSGNPAEEIAGIAAHPDRWYVYASALLLSSCLLVPAVLGVMALLRESAPRWSALAGGLALAGVLISIGDAAVELMYWQMGAPGADRGQMVALAQRYETTLGTTLPYTVGGLAVVIGIALLAVALWRTRVAPRWCGGVLLLASIAQVVGFTTSRALLIGSFVALLAAFTPMALRLLQDAARPVSRSARNAVASPASSRS